ncbi:hypothetical protein B0H19DRAFT_1072583 [Mycena capillaripes]|nr:hypothetical protein B0H19DRAFT_1072583 [Mycena capillaripes]
MASVDSTDVQLLAVVLNPGGSVSLFGITPPSQYNQTIGIKRRVISGSRNLIWPREVALIGFRLDAITTAGQYRCIALYELQTSSLLLCRVQISGHLCEHVPVKYCSYPHSSHEMEDGMKSNLQFYGMNSASEPSSTVASAPVGWVSRRTRGGCDTERVRDDGQLGGPSWEDIRNPEIERLLIGIADPASDKDIIRKIQNGPIARGYLWEAMSCYELL